VSVSNLPVKLRIRNLQSREAGVVVFESEADALSWLAARPRFVDVVGVGGTVALPKDVEARLRAAVRPLDVEERIAERELEIEQEKAELARAKEALEKEAEAREKHAAEMRTADPARIMEVRWRFDAGMTLTDAHDPRVIPDVARAAVLAWIAERNEWIEGRGQTIGECTVHVWPGDLPAGETERVKDGRFFPVSAGEREPPS
jgi:hypothetical protein